MPQPTPRSLARVGALATVIAIVAIAAATPRADRPDTPSTGPAPGRAVVRPVAELSDAFIAISEAAMPAIVRVEAEFPPGDGGNRRIPPELREFFDNPTVPDNTPRLSGGTGFIVRADGYILTNGHVVRSADAVRVTMYDKRQYDALVVGLDPTTDVALLKIDATGLPTMKMGDSDATRVGQWVLAVGNPGFGAGHTLDFTVTSGIISAKGRPLDILGQELQMEEDGPGAQYAIEDFIQTDAVINPGNSGGPLVDLNGEAIGINTAIASGTGFYEGYGFAIPMNLARRVMTDLLEEGRVRRALLGVTIRDVYGEDAEVYGLPNIGGVVVQDFAASSPAAAAGLRAQDVIVSIDGQPVDRVGQLQRLIAQHRPGETVRVGVIRHGADVEASVRLMEAPLSAPMLPKPDLAPKRTELGLEFEELTAPLARKYGYARPGGAVIASVKPDGAAVRARYALLPGLRVLQLDQSEISSVGEARAVLAGKKSGDILTVVTAGPAGGRRVANVRIP